MSEKRIKNVQLRGCSVMNQTIKYLTKRIFTYGLTIWVAISFSFLLFRIIPGNPVEAFIAQMYTTQQLSSAETYKQLLDMYVKEFGLGEDVWTQYVKFWTRLILYGDVGPSFINFPRPSMEIVLQGLPWTIGLLGTSAIMSWLFGNLLGAFLGWKHNSKTDRSVVMMALTFSPIPYYLTAIILMLLVFYLAGVILYGAYNPYITPQLSLEFILSLIQYGALPALSIAISSAAGWIISMRSLIVPILGEDYLIFAEAKGLEKKRLFLSYSLRNALLPQITSLAITLGSMMSGSILVENIFNYPGVGFIFNVALRHLDYNTIMACLIIVICSVLTANLLIDLLLPFIDPRIKYGG